MAAYVAYAWEHETWPQFRQVWLTEKESVKYLRKFARHFKMPDAKVEFSKRKERSGEAWPNIYHAVTWKPEYRRLSKAALRNWSSGVICLTKDRSSLDVVIHEFAHLLTAFKYKRMVHHDKRFKRQLKRVYTFAKRYLPKQEAKIAA